MSGEFWAAVVGAIVGALAGGGISAWLQMWDYKRARADTNNGLAHSLFFKLYAVYSDLDGFKTYVNGELTSASEAGLTPGWQSLKPIANGPAEIQFSPEEMTFLLSLRNFDLFNLVHSLDRVHRSTISMFALYAERRIALTSTLPAQMEGPVGSIDLRLLTPEMRGRAEAVGAELQSIYGSIIQRVDFDAGEAWRALAAYNEIIRPVLGYSFSIEKVGHTPRSLTTESTD